MKNAYGSAKSLKYRFKIRFWGIKINSIYPKPFKKNLRIQTPSIPICISPPSTDTPSSKTHTYGYPDAVTVRHWRSIGFSLRCIHGPRPFIKTKRAQIKEGTPFTMRIKLSRCSRRVFIFILVYFLMKMRRWKRKRYLFFNWRFVLLRIEE